MVDVSLGKHLCPRSWCLEASTLRYYIMCRDVIAFKTKAKKVFGSASQCLPRCAGTLSSDCHSLSVTFWQERAWAPAGTMQDEGTCTCHRGLLPCKKLWEAPFARKLQKRPIFTYEYGWRPVHCENHRDLPREVVDASFLQTFQVRLYRALSNLI